jgi:hypothetical protein
MVWNDDMKPTPLKLGGGRGGGDPLPLGDCQKNLSQLNAQKLVLKNQMMIIETRNLRFK